MPINDNYFIKKISNNKTTKESFPIIFDLI